MGIIGMKIAGRGRILSSWTPPPVEHQQRSWAGVVTTTRAALRYPLSLPVSTVVVGCDNSAQLEGNVQIAPRVHAPVPSPDRRPRQPGRARDKTIPVLSLRNPRQGYQFIGQRVKRPTEQSSDWEWLKFLRLLDAPIVPYLNVILHDAPRQESHESLEG